MQLFASLLTAAASVFVMISGLEHHEHAGHGVPLKTRASRRSQAPIGGDSSVWTPKKPCSSSSASLASSCYPSSSAASSCYPSSSAASSCYPSSSLASSCYPSSSSCAPRCSRNRYSSGIGCYPFTPAAVAPLSPVAPCEPLYGAYPGPCERPCPSPCGPRPRAVVGRAQPWYIYLTATYTSTYSTTTSILTTTEVDSDTVSYTIFQIASSDVPNAYYPSV